MKSMYFQSKDAEICYPLSYFKWLIEREGITEMTLYKAKKQDVQDYFWCHYFAEVGDISEGGCGNQCPGYAPKNGKSGCCRHYSLKFYEPTDEKIVLKS